MNLSFIKQLAHTIPNGAILMFDQNLTFILAEGAALNKHGFSKEQIEGKTVEDVLSPASRDILLPYYRDTCNGKRHQFTHESAAGTFWVRFEPVFENDQWVAGLLMVIEVTELEVQKKELQDYFYILSHDIRSPLSSILGLIEIYRLEDDAQEKERLLNMIEQMTRKSLAFISDLLDQKIIPVDLQAIVAEIREKLVHHSQYPIIDFRSEFQYRKGRFYSVPSLLRSVLENLLTNACKYHDPQKSNHYVHLKVWEEQKDIGISVADNGLGIPETALQSIFQKNYQLNQHTEGHGYGLYLVMQNIKKLGGTIQVESEAGKGTIFIIKIPKTEPPTASLNE